MNKKIPLRTRNIQDRDDIRRFFDEIAGDYRESHGTADRLLRYRLRIIKTLLPEQPGGTLLEIGCGTGDHLMALAQRFTLAIGTDLSPAMIARAERLRQQHPLRQRIAFRADPAEALQTLADGEADVALCVGALEHMPDPQAVLAQVRRVLKPGGIFICLTPNANYLWYRTIAPRFGYAIRHLSSDRFLSRDDLLRLSSDYELTVERIGHWTFIPRGDMPEGYTLVLTLLDGLGRLISPDILRGGLYCRARKPL